MREENSSDNRVKALKFADQNHVLKGNNSNMKGNNNSSKVKFSWGSHTVKGSNHEYSITLPEKSPNKTLIQSLYLPSPYPSSFINSPIQEYGPHGQFGRRLEFQFGRAGGQFGPTSSFRSDLHQIRHG
ncbi:Uncharacterized protein Adt_12261 [Abeliophyllum distichum]|uniref:Uncharacterized protein n=1 Tax=Abeliophyllum distichum TaxID=126358 RepID=A0ABD1UQ82_9LAMI